MTAPSDSTLISGCLRGDERAWSQLVERYERLVYSIARTEGLDPSEAEDLTQTVFMALMGALHGLRDTDRLAGWLATVTRRHAWRRRDMARRNIPVEPQDAHLETTADAGSPTERTADLVTLLEAIGSLSDRCQRLVMILYFGAGDPSYEEVARQLDMPIGSIGPTRARCLDKLRKLLESDPHYDPVTFG